MIPRYSARKKATCKVTLSCGARVGEGQVLDLTVPGCLLETALMLEYGQPVQIRIYLDTQRPMRIDLGIVRWAQDGKAGIEFIRMGGDDQTEASFLCWPYRKTPPAQRHLGGGPAVCGLLRCRVRREPRPSAEYNQSFCAS